MKILGVSFFLLAALLVISLAMDMLQGFSFYGAVQNNLSAFKLTTFSEWLMLFLFALFLIREMIALYKSGKKDA
ncbi:hypothetical protein IM717_16005 [Bacillus velezensis]|jgi:hypothetical protein|uniref:hypothetical protein n=1 Tax=Bacillus TaxID=1386 RepID=UPI000500F847|nr:MULTISPECIES: hypothetical protein [Bacillus]ARM26667.1 hypothetical protein B9C48_01945 [Bacillus vallismortis]ANF35257.1 hypothetical protein BCBMB205_03520 [Bacillus velezensis]ANS37200.1 hypothetical protein A5891_01910 [Bacillus velezensis]ANU28957.1 hypothetical protein A8142_01760 [Bacillus velezensis]APQ50351.1 hypothetical protein BSO20_10000 [Bacillus amyloliquefaciens]